MDIKKKQLGQYFTPNFVADFMVSLSSVQKSAQILEPSSGTGIFLSSLYDDGYKNILGLEIDQSLKTTHKDLVRYESFVSAKFDKKFDLIIGNPPYVRWKNMTESQRVELSNDYVWKKYFNSLSDLLYLFILKSVEQLKEGGELIFITPEYWLNTMHSLTLRNYLTSNGYLAEAYHFSETPIFDKVASSIIIFKYVKTSRKEQRNKKAKIHKYSSKSKLVKEDLENISDNPSWTSFEVKQFKPGESWILAPEDIKSELELYEKKCAIGIELFRKPALFYEDDVSYVKLGDITDIANGLVSGLDQAFQIDDDISLNQAESKALIQVVKARDMQSFFYERLRPYIYLNETIISEEDFQKEYPTFTTKLAPFKMDLEKRYSYNKDANYWDWIFLRSMKTFKQKRSKIFVPCKERISNKERLRFSYVEEDIFPTQDVTAIYLNDDVKESIYYILALLNSKLTYNWVKYKGLIKGAIAEFSERPLSSIPIRLINWDDTREVALHNEIVSRVKKSIQDKRVDESLDELVLQLLN